jgi:uncharacterized repeat protein (TIGR03803 family)
MKRSIIFALAMCLLAMALATSPARAQNGFTNLHSFDFTDGFSPYAGVTLSGSTLYGTTERGGSAGGAAVYKINTDGSGFTNFLSFGGTAHTIGGVVVSGSTVFGVTLNPGIVFAVSTNGIGLITLHDFGTGGGSNPEATLTLGGSTLFGTTANGDNLFQVSTGGTGFTNLYSFSATSGPLQTNSDGVEQAEVAAPFGNQSTYGSLIQSGTTLFGIAIGGGTGGSGTIFSFNLINSNFTTLYSFSAKPGTTNADGANPVASMVLSGGVLYGTTLFGASNGNGGIFRINTDGSHFTNLYSFSPLLNSTNSDGANPLGALVLSLSGSSLYGAAYLGGLNGQGTVFKINTDGSDFATLYNFSPVIGGSATNSDGANPMGAMVLSGGVLYGATQGGGIHGDGTVFALSASPTSVPLNIRSISNAVVLTWSNPALFLQSAPTLTGAYTNVIGASSPFTNANTASNAFFRLKSN